MFLKLWTVTRLAYLGLGLAWANVGSCQDADPVKQAGTTKAVVTQETVNTLLEQMKAGGLEQRDAAEKAIVELGTAVSEFLPEISDNTSGEMKIRLQRIGKEIGRSSTPETSSIEASRCSIEGEMSVESAFAKIQEQTGNRVELQGNQATPKVELELEDATFWEAVGEIMQQANLALVPYSAADDALVLQAGGGASDYSLEPHLNGPFRIDPVSVRAQRGFGANQQAQLELNLNVSWEPRLKPTALTIPMANVLAVAEGGSELQPTSPDARPTIALNSGGATTTITLLLQSADRAAAKLDSLKGELTFAIPGEVQQFKFDKLNSGARRTKKNGSVSVTLASFARNRRTYEARVLVVVDDAASVRRMLQSQEGYLLDSKDVRIENVGDFEFPGVAGSAGLAYLFGIRGDPADYRFVFEMPGGFTEASTAYVVKDIPLP